MCGITGYIGKKQAAPILLRGLEKLEYRGYDSAGIAVRENSAPDAKINIVKAKGRLKALLEKTDCGRAVPGLCGSPVAANILKPSVTHVPKSGSSKPTGKMTSRNIGSGPTIICRPQNNFRRSCKNQPKSVTGKCCRPSDGKNRRYWQRLPNRKKGNQAAAENSCYRIAGLLRNSTSSCKLGGTGTAD